MGINPQEQATPEGTYPPEPMGPTYFEDLVRELRAQTKALAEKVRALSRLSADDAKHPELRAMDVDVEELQANIILAYRHLEDARMRLGKAIQAYDGGISVYDK